MTEARDRIEPGPVARWLQQRVEMGQPPLFLDTLARAEVLTWAGALRARARAPAPHPAPPRPSVPVQPPPRAPKVAAAAAATAAPAAAPPALDLSDVDHDALVDLIRACTRCGLHETRTQAVPYDGVLTARVMVVGEAPGAREDEVGRPFVGDAGRLLDLMLASVDLSREDSVYICNVLKCRPPGNRNPRPDEIASCAPYLQRQIELVRPEAILAVGNFAARLLTKSDPRATLGSMRGTVHHHAGVPLVVTYHPAALLRNPAWSRLAWDDLQLLRGLLEAA